MPKKRLQKIIELIQSMRTRQPDMDHLDFSNYHQTEAEYQKEQQEWLESRPSKKKRP